jgi:drug/metabolite transporter (DMT)-like permease
MRPLVLGALAICVSATLWGVDGVVLTPRLYNLDVLQVVFLLHAVPFLFMQLFLARSYAALGALRAGEWVTLAMVALTGGVLGTFAIVQALFLVNFNQLSVVVLLQKLQPVFALLLAALLLGERLTPRMVSRAALALLGAYLLTFGARWPDLGGDSKTTAAALWALLAAGSFGAATVFGKRLLGALDFKQATFGRYAMTVVITLAALLATRGGISLAAVTPENWMFILIIGATSGSGALFLYYFGLTRVRAGIATICEMCLPLSAILLDYLINDSVLGPWQWLGAAILLTAITLVTLRPGPRAAS